MNKKSQYLYLIAIIKLFIINNDLNVYCNSEYDLDSNNVFSINISELENELIPTLDDNATDTSDKLNSSINMVVFSTKYQRLSTQLSLKYSCKIDILSPMWFTLIPDRSNPNSLKLKIDGHNNYKKDLIDYYKELVNNCNAKKLQLIDDSNYIPDFGIKDPSNAIINSNKDIKASMSLVIPRLSCEHNFRFLSDQTSFFNQKSIEVLSNDIIKRLKHYKLDGIYLDCLDLQINNDFKPSYIDLIKILGSKMRDNNKIFILGIHPISEKVNHFIDSKSIKNTYTNYVDYFYINIGNYNIYTRKPINYYNAPIYWMDASVKEYSDFNNMNKIDKNTLFKDLNILSKFIVNIPFNGIQYVIKENEKASITNIDSTTFTSIIVNAKSKNKLSHKWDVYGAEHLIHVVNDYSDIYISYPTKKFISERLNYIKEYNIGGLAINDLMLGFENMMSYF